MPDPELRDASRDGTSNSHWEARRRAERQQKGLIATTGRRTLATFTQLAKHERVEPVPSDDDIDEHLQSMLKAPDNSRGSALTQVGTMTGLASQPSDLEGTLPPRLQSRSIGCSNVREFLPQPTTRARRTNDTWETALQSRPPLTPRASAGAPFGAMSARTVGAPAPPEIVVHTDGKIPSEYPSLPTDVYRKLAENGRKHGIGSAVQVRF